MGWFRKATKEEKRSLLGEIKKELDDIRQMDVPRLQIGGGSMWRQFKILFSRRLKLAEDKFNILYKNVPREERDNLVPLSHMLELMFKHYKEGSYDHLGQALVDAIAEIEHLLKEVYPS